mgnify:CR=1 FL=1
MLYKKYHRSYVRQFKKDVKVISKIIKDRNTNNFSVFTLISNPIIEFYPPRRIIVRPDISLGIFVLIDEYGRLNIGLDIVE